jgi:hypothetical protein
MTKTCLECNEPIKGRADKKFCSDACRNAQNNKFNKDSTNLMRQINRILRKNRMILSKLNPTGKSVFHKTTLIQNGYNFDYFTNTYKTKEGKVYYFCYEHGFLPIDNNRYALVVKKEYQKKE